MRNADLIAFLKPVSHQFSRKDSVEFLDVTDRLADIEANSFRLRLRFEVSAGLYRGRFETHAHAFDMSTAMIEMVRVPDGKRVLVGPWDLDHIHNVMAVPMMRVWVNGKLKGGLWFAMPGPEQIAAGRLVAEFGFEADKGENELILEIVERDRARMDWGRIAFFELRQDDRRTVPLLPATRSRPRIFLTADNVEAVRERWKSNPEFSAQMERMRTEDLVLLTDNSQGTLEIAGLLYALTGDRDIGLRAKAKIMDLAHSATWSGRPDPLLMGGDNDRVIGMRLYQSALAWDWLQPLFGDEDRGALLAKAEEYLQKIYDFTLLQRAYMGCPAIDPHSLGAWNGAAIACMSFYEDLAIARHALPFFHGLFCDSLKLFPSSGKAAWATYFPFHLVLYLAAARTFAGALQELSSSPFLDHLGEALLASFAVPNAQEMQRGLRTREHRFLTAFLCYFHPTPGIEATYRAFAERERAATGEVLLGIFDLLYAPAPSGHVASIPDRPLFARDVGEIIASCRSRPRIAISVSGAAKSGRAAAFSLMSHNREFAPSLGALEVTVDGVPVLSNINLGQYGINSALTNTMCFGDGGARTNGQYLNGAIAPEHNAVIRRCLIGERFLYAQIIVTHSLDAALHVERADRVLVFDRTTGVILLSDAFSGSLAIRFATHLHCSGSVTELERGLYRLTGGQANRIAGIKGGSKGLSDEEKGEIFVHVLESVTPSQVVVEEPTWVPGYIYGMNHTGLEQMSDGCFPRYRRWRLETQEPVTRSAFLFSLSAQPDQVRYADGAILVPGGGARLGGGVHRALGVECECECLLWEDAPPRISALGLRSMREGNSCLRFALPVDVEFSLDAGDGVLYGQAARPPRENRGYIVSSWVPAGQDAWKSHSPRRAVFKRAGSAAATNGDKR